MDLVNTITFKSISIYCVYIVSTCFYISITHLLKQFEAIMSFGGFRGLLWKETGDEQAEQQQSQQSPWEGCIHRTGIPWYRHNGMFDGFCTIHIWFFRCF